jgi:hypothetical protein
MLIEIAGQYFRVDAKVLQHECVVLPNGLVLASYDALDRSADQAVSPEAPPSREVRILHDDLGYHSRLQMLELPAVAAAHVQFPQASKDDAACDSTG